LGPKRGSRGALFGLPNVFKTEKNDTENHTENTIKKTPKTETCVSKEREARYNLNKSEALNIFPE